MKKIIFICLAAFFIVYVSEVLAIGLNNSSFDLSVKKVSDDCLLNGKTLKHGYIKTIGNEVLICNNGILINIRNLGNINRDMFSSK